jgi:methionyl-tRNA synthetase
MLGSNYDGVVPEADPFAAAGPLPALVDDVVERLDAAMEIFSLTAAVAAVWEIVSEANRYLVERSPWKLAKEGGHDEELAEVLYASAEVLRILAVLIQPVMPSAAERLWEQLGISDPLASQRLPEAARWGGLAAGTKTSKGDPLFPRLDE